MGIISHFSFRIQVFQNFCVFIGIGSVLLRKKSRLSDMRNLPLALFSVSAKRNHLVQEIYTKMTL